MNNSEESVATLHEIAKNPSKFKNHKAAERKITETIYKYATFSLIIDQATIQSTNSINKTNNCQKDVTTFSFDNDISAYDR